MDWYSGCSNPFIRHRLVERFLPVCLVLLLRVGSAVAGVQTVSEPHSGLSRTALPSEDASPAHEDPWEPGYGEISRQGSEWAQGDLIVSVPTGALRPARGYIPLDLLLRNDGVSTRFVHLGFTPDGARAEAASRDVEVAPHQRLVVWLPIPISMRYGTTRLRGGGLDLQPFSFSALDARGEAVWVLG